jgi:uncharacterized protein (TIGR02246 family)
LTGAAADVVAILELLARYNRALDDSDGNGWADCFADDGVFDGLLGRVEGRDALRRFAAGYHEEFPRFAHTCHWSGNAIVDVDPGGDRARLRVDSIIIDVGPAGPRILHLTRNDDALRKIDGRWRFALRRGRPFGTAAG